MHWFAAINWLLQCHWVGHWWPLQDYLISSYTEGRTEFFQVLELGCTLENFMGTLENRLTASHPFHAKLLCHRPQINYQESGREQMWPTPNWLHQNAPFSLPLVLPCSAPPFTFLYCTEHCVISFTVDLNMCLAHVTDIMSPSLTFHYKTFPCVTVHTFPITWAKAHWILRDFKCSFGCVPSEFKYF